MTSERRSPRGWDAGDSGEGAATAGGDARHGRGGERASAAALTASSSSSGSGSGWARGSRNRDRDAYALWQAQHRTRHHFGGDSSDDGGDESAFEPNIHAVGAFSPKSRQGGGRGEGDPSRWPRSEALSVGDQAGASVEDLLREAANNVAAMVANNSLLRRYCARLETEFSEVHPRMAQVRKENHELALGTEALLQQLDRQVSGDGRGGAAAGAATPSSSSSSSFWAGAGAASLGGGSSLGGSGSSGGGPFMKPADAMRLRKVRNDFDATLKEFRNVAMLISEVESEIAEYTASASGTSPAGGEGGGRASAPARAAVPTMTKASTPSSSSDAASPPAPASGAPAIARRSASDGGVRAPEHAVSRAPLALPQQQQRLQQDEEEEEQSEKQAATDSYGTFQQQQQLATRDARRQTALDAQYARQDAQERSTLVQRIQSSIHEVNAIFKDLSAMIGEQQQQQQLDDIEANAASVRTEQSRTARELETMQRRRQRRRRCCTWLLVWTVLFGALVLYILVH